jgi:hypothetical protein
MFDEQIAKGVEFLDIEFGIDWVFDIDLSELDLSSAGSCVVGQLSMGDVFYDLVTDTSLGFDINAIDAETDYSILTQEWREAIAQLIAERSAQ